MMLLHFSSVKSATSVYRLWAVLQLCPPELGCNTRHNPQTSVALFLVESSHVLDYGESCILGVVLTPQLLRWMAMRMYSVHCTCALV